MSVSLIKASPRFIEDWDDIPHHCVGFDTPWNGWATPVVTLEQLRSLANRWDAAYAHDSFMTRIDMSGPIPLVIDSDPDVDDYPLKPWESDGLYHLGELGLTLWELPAEWPAVDTDD